MAMQSKKPWKEKLRPDLEPHVEDDPRGRMLIPTPMLVAGAIRRVRRGSLTTPRQFGMRWRESTAPISPVQ
ncbi:MAG: hypothetical protein U0163_05580 [Gemmatimonadaceae bacterium]